MPVMIPRLVFGPGKIDSNVNAVVLADVGSSKIEGNSKGWFSIIYNHIRRVKILNKKAFDSADVSIGLYAPADGRVEKLSKCKAITYNLENGEVKQTKLEASNIFKEKKNKRVVIKKFTFPNVKEGSILEYAYTIESDFLFNFQPWDFQGDYPRVFTQYTVKIPNFLVYVFLSQGNFPIKVDKKERFQTYIIADATGTGATERASFKLSDEEQRENEIVYDYAFIDRDTVNIKIPAGYTIENQPKPVSINNKFGKYSTEYAFKDGNLQLIRIYERGAGRFPASDYNDFKEFYNTIYKADNARMVFVKQGE